jgi:hypothetical protein
VPSCFHSRGDDDAALTIWSRGLPPKGPAGKEDIISFIFWRVSSSIALSAYVRQEKRFSMISVIVGIKSPKIIVGKIIL